MSDYHKCSWCGNSFEKSGGAKFLSGATMGFSNLGAKYCSKSCEHAAEESKNGPKSSSTKNVTPTGANASGGENVTVVNKGDGFLTTGVKGMFGMANDIIQKDFEGMRNNKAKLETKIEEVVRMTFRTDANEISNQLNHLVSLGSTNPDKPLKNAIIEKLEFGIMKLRGLNASSEADYFEKKLEPLKKKSWF